jgi:hypothetical protein
LESTQNQPSFLRPKFWALETKSTLLRISSL